MAKKTITLKKPQKDSDRYISKRLLDLTKRELKGDITSLRLEMNAGFANIDARFKQMDARFKQMDARFIKTDARFESIQTQLTKMMVILEDQNERNKVAYDGYIVAYEKLFSHDERLAHLEKHNFGIKQI